MGNTEIGTITLKCGKCGGEQFSAPAEPKPEDHATCVACGNVVQLDDFIAKAREEAIKVADAFAEALRKALK